MVNWIGTENPFGMECPPDWWMKGLYDFDHMLVLIPSQRKREYLLTRRRTMTQVDAGAVLLDNKNPDTKFCILNGIIPIAPLKWKSGVVGVFSQVNLDSLLNALRARDTYVYTHAGAQVDEDAAWKAVEAEEAAQEARDRALMKENFHHMGRDAYRSLKARTGQRSKRASDAHGVAAQPKRVILTDA